jgi:hypothetical protein
MLCYLVDKGVVVLMPKLLQMNVTAPVISKLYDAMLCCTDAGICVIRGTTPFRTTAAYKMISATLEAQAGVGPKMVSGLKTVLVCVVGGVGVVFAIVFIFRFKNLVPKRLASHPGESAGYRCYTSSSESYPVGLVNMYLQ